MADKKKKTLTDSVELPGTKTVYNRNTANPTTSGEAATALGAVNKNAPGQYQTSDTVTQAYQQLQDTLASKPGDYQSQYSGQINTLLDNILQQKDFKYDFNADALYKNYKNQYEQAGKQAMLDTQAAASALTGGYGSSYGASAGSQAYQQYLTQLNDKIPDLYQMALQKYQMDTDKMYDQLSAVSAQEDREYGQHRDKVSDWQTDRNYGLNQYNNMYSQDYGAYRDQVSDFYNDRDYLSSMQNNLWNQEFNKEQFEYQKERDAIADAQWAQSFNYNQSRDAVSDNQWQQSFDYTKGRDTVSDEQWQKAFEYEQQRDAISDAQWEKAFNASKTSSKNTTSGEYADGKKLTDDIEEQMQFLEGDELDAYLGRLVERGYSYAAIEDYLAQIGKYVEDTSDDEEAKRAEAIAWIEEMQKQRLGW